MKNDLCSRMEHEAALLLEARCAILQLKYDLEETRKERENYRDRLLNMVAANERLVKMNDNWRQAYHDARGDIL